MRCLLARVPSDTGFAFVVIQQHLDATLASALIECSGHAATMPVKEIVDGTPVEPNCVYVIPPGAALTIENRVLKLHPRNETEGRWPVDHFLQSLARDDGPRAIGVILSGAGSDGSLGLQAVKEAGGITFAREPTSAEFPSMPTLADAAACADFVFSPEQIGDELGRIARHPQFAVSKDAEPTRLQNNRDAQFRAIVTIMNDASGIDFSACGESTLRRCILRRLALRNITDLEEYAMQLEVDPRESSALHQDLLIGVTSFFRDPEAFEALKKVVFPAIVRNRQPDLAIRIWVSGCATGEEAYSIAISLQEYLTENGLTFGVQIFASDSSEATIEKARRGRYLTNVEADVSPERLSRFFAKVEGGYQVSRALRQMCVFTQHDVISDPPFSGLDLISCRSVPIYLQPVRRKTIIWFHYALREPGFLMLGRAETMPLEDLFSVVSHDLSVYARRQAVKTPQVLYSPAITPRRRFGPDRSPTVAPVSELWDGTDIGKAVDHILMSGFCPAAVLVDEDLNVIEVRAQTASFLKPSTGRGSLHLVKLIPDVSLFWTIEKLIHKAVRTEKPARQERVAYETGGGVNETNIEVIPVPAAERCAHLVVFGTVRAIPEPSRKSPRGRGTGAAVIDDRDRSIAKLYREMGKVRRRLLSIVEGHRLSEQENENVTANVLSANEELKSLNEELETAKEELRSANEELLRVNGELSARNASLTRAHDLAMEIVEAIQLPLLVLDGALGIKTVNTFFSRVFQLSQDEAEGHTIDAVCNGRWNFPGLKDRLKRVLSDGQSFEGFEVEGEFPSIGRRVLRLSGCHMRSPSLVLLAADDITALRDAELAVHGSEARRVEAVGRLAGGIAHDFGNVLAAITAYTGLIADSLGEGHEAFEYVREIENATTKAVTLTDQLLATSLQRVLQPRIFDPNRVVADSASLVRPLVADHIKIRVRLAPDLWRAVADPGEIGRVVMNLCVNARDAMPSRGILTISTANVTLDESAAHARNLRAGQYVGLEVRDTGIGMSAETRAHIFEPFFTTKVVGRGLGLATVRGVIDQSGGAIWCASERGKGTTFTVLLPATEQMPRQVEQPAHREAETARGRGEVLLLVEDEDLVRTPARTILEARGYKVIEARDGLEGLSVCEGHEGGIDLLVSDLIMPGLGGRELADRALMIRPEMKVLFISAYTEDLMRREGLRNGVPFLRKPFSAVDLARSVRDALDSPRDSGPLD